MFLTLLGILVSASCAVASVKRLRMVAGAWALDPTELVKLAPVAETREGAAPRTPVWTALRAEVAAERGAEWEADLFESLDAPLPGRVALVNQQLGELEYRARRWGRVPRVCASISTSFGFLLGAVVMSAGLASADVELGDSVIAAVNVVAVGIAGTAFCIAAQIRAEAMVRARLVATDKLVMRLERAAPPVEAPRANRAT